jgi:hypothetical protein
VRNGRSPASSCPTVELGARLHLNVVRDVTTANGPLDAVAGRFDAGIHLGEFIERDMIATRISRDPRAAIVASLRYFESHPRPKSPATCRIIAASTSAWDRGRVPMGVRPGLEVARRRRQRAADPRRHGHDDRRRRLTVSASRSRWRIPLRRTSQAGRWSESSKIGARPSPASSSIIRVDGNSRLR